MSQDKLTIRNGWVTVPENVYRALTTENVEIVNDDCAWCLSNQAPHALACPFGERGKATRDCGGIPLLPAAKVKAAV